MCQWEKKCTEEKNGVFLVFWKGKSSTKDFPFMGSKRYCVNCILPAIPFASALCEWKQLPFIPRFLLRCLLQGISYYIEDCPSYYFPWKPWNDESSAWFPIWGSLKSIFQFFMFYVCFLDFFFISCVGCFTNIWEIEAKILIFQKIITTYRISVSKMIPAGFSGVHFFLFLIQNQTYCRLVGVLATNCRIRYSANKASYRTWTLSEVLLHMLITDAASDFSFINFGNFLLRLKLYLLLISWKSLGRIRQQVSEYVRLPSFWLSFGMLLGMLQSHVGKSTSCTCESAL